MLHGHLHGGGLRWSKVKRDALEGTRDNVYSSRGLAEQY